MRKKEEFMNTSQEMNNQLEEAARKFNLKNMEFRKQKRA